jgi:predicted regulator of Ras-like GTPase activity (Roadblock/LC7/MglB family)
VPDAAATAPAPADAEATLAFLTEMSPDLRGGAILTGDGTVLAASGEAAAWAEEAVNLLRVADAAGDEPVEQVHVATQAGEVFALRAHGFAAVTVTERFALASLTFFDMRSALRELAGGSGAERGSAAGAAGEDGED